MLLRRIRGILTSALIWGSVVALSASALMSIMILPDPRRGPMRGFLGELLDVFLVFFGCGAALGGGFALIVTVAARKSSVDTLPSSRFTLWGAAGGVLAGLGIASFLLWSSAPLTHTSLGIIVLECGCAGVIGSHFVLRAARDSRQELRA